MAERSLSRLGSHELTARRNERDFSAPSEAGRSPATLGPAPPSLQTLANAQLRRSPGAPLRDVLAGDDPRWLDDLEAWRIAQQLVREAGRRVMAFPSMGKSGGERDSARARWLYGVALDLAEETRAPAVRAERMAQAGVG